MRASYLTDWTFVLLVLVQGAGIWALTVPGADLPFGAVFAAAFLAVLLDRLLLPSPAGWTGNLELDAIPELGHGVRIRARLRPPPGAAFLAPRLRVSLPPLRHLAGGQAVLPLRREKGGDRRYFGAEFRLTAESLGYETVGEVTLIAESRFRLWTRHVRVAVDPLRYRVLPTRREVSPQAFRQILRQQRLLFQGNRNTLRGRAADQFLSVRPYRFPDPIRHIDPKKTAKFGELMTRIYDTYFNQHLVLALDLGRGMLGHLGESRKTDYYLSACLALAQNAVKSQDRVSFFGFSQRVHYTVRGARGMGEFQRVFEGDERLRPLEVESNYELLAPTLGKLTGVRSLVVLFTDVTKPSVAEGLLKALPALTARHLTVIVSLVDKDYLLDDQIARERGAPLTPDRLNRLLYCYWVDEAVESFRLKAAALECGVVTVSESDWLAVVVRLYSLLRTSVRI